MFKRPLPGRGCLEREHTFFFWSLVGWLSRIRNKLKLYYFKLVPGPAQPFYEGWEISLRSPF